MQLRIERTLTLAGAVGAVILSVLAVWYWQRGAAPEVAVAAAPAEPTWDWLIGPGVPRGVPPAVMPEAVRDPGLALDSGGHLVAGPELRRLMDAYLARGPVDSRAARAQQLQAFLKRELVAPAAAEGERIAVQYLHYLETEERLLAREGFSATALQHLAERDVQRLLAYRDQRAQLRERMLGAAQSRTWFEADDSRCMAALREWQVQHVAPEPGQELDPVEIRERRIHGAALEARRDEDAQACAAQMSRADGGA